MKKKKSNESFPFITWLLATIILFIAAVNTIPSFASSISDTPVLGHIVKAVDFGGETSSLELNSKANFIASSAKSDVTSVTGNPVKTFSFEYGLASGGTITDNVNVKTISVEKENGMEHIGIHFTQRGEEEEFQLLAPVYKIKYQESPYTMTFTIHGARAFDANEFINLKNSDLVEDAYWLVTHDDSAIRFTIVFKGPVIILGEEYANPAQLVVSVSAEEEPTATKLYTVRTTSHLFGGDIPYYEEYLFNEKGLRVLRESGILFSTWESEFYLEVGLYKNKEDAEEKASEINEKYGHDIHVFVEERDVPGR
ncbi:hypothetical protein [Sporosarcina highlanderae]|uniref:SPOR domain-containing protein n=1 Tax=Sporosarcina highlanderae TaxID=3035916 RepID=A0ABT8JRG0_9BACL|nr:hypothetical protein [Sporosarcina highlanderae]MDN4607734.1 hypothetical protein [Sporosarcina highlanderae]